MPVNASAGNLTVFRNYFVGQNVAYEFDVMREVDLVGDAFFELSYRAELIHYAQGLGNIGTLTASNESIVPFEIGDTTTTNTSLASDTFTLGTDNTGTYEVSIELDHPGAIAEANENDNQISTQFNVFDAVSLSLGGWVPTVDTFQFEQGENMSTLISLSNVHSALGQDLSGYDVRVVLSADAVFDGTDITIANFALGDIGVSGDGQLYSFSGDLILPEAVLAGSYKLGLIYDPGDEFFEDFEDKTELLGDVKVLAASDPTNYDFSIANFVVAENALEDGETVQINFDLVNGGTFGTYEGALDLSISLSRNGVIIPLSTTSGSYVLEAGSNNNLDLQDLLSQDVDPIAPGDYQLNLTVDGNSLIDETDETNNTASIDFTILPTSSSSSDGSSDFDSNGSDDILFYRASDRSVGQFSMPDGSWSTIGRAGSGWEVAGLGQFDADDTSTDILWFNQSTGALGRFDMDGGANSGWDGIGRAGAGWDAIGAGDLNGDGIDDILWFNEATGSVGQFRVIDGQPSWLGVGSTGTGWVIAGIADFNGDNVDDILWQNASTGSLGQFRMDENGKEWLTLTRMSAGWEAVDTGDFAGDAIADILVFNESTRQIGYYAISEVAAEQQIDWISLGIAGEGWSIQGTGDFNGDSVDDILWRHEDGRMGQFVMEGQNTGYGWSALSAAGADWDVVL